MAKQVWQVQEPYVNLGCVLGEGPFYEAEHDRLRFVDIGKKQLHTIDLAAGPASVHTLQLDQRISATSDIAGVDPQEKIAVGLKYGLAVLDRQTGSYEYIGRFSMTERAEGTGGEGEGPSVDNERVRGNDGAADPHGRFWLGSMTDFDLGDFQPEGALFRFDGPSRSGQLVRPGLTIPNGIGWSPDARTMYFTDTTARKLYAFDYDATDGHLSNERVVYVHPGPGYPDGFRVDVEGHIWHAIYGEGCVLRIDPSDGRILAEVRLPTLHTTCPQFAGTKLFVTTAETTPDDALGGALFCVDVGVEGLPLFPFRYNS